MSGKFALDLSDLNVNKTKLRSRIWLKIVHLYKLPIADQGMGFCAGDSALTTLDSATVAWLKPLPIRCPATNRAVSKLYLQGNPSVNLLPHRSVQHLDVRNRGKYSNLSKVMKRQRTESVKCPLFLEREGLTDLVQEFDYCRHGVTRNAARNKKIYKLNNNSKMMNCIRPTFFKTHNRYLNQFFYDNTFT